jgi:hypothetical protein
MDQVCLFCLEYEMLTKQTYVQEPAMSKALRHYCHFFSPYAVNLM